MFSERKPLDFAHLITVPRSSGCYIIYDIAGPIYVGRSGSDIRARLQSHFRGTGSRNIAFALRVGAGASLYFRYCGLPKAAQRDAEAALIRELGVAKFANLRKETLGEDWTWEDDVLKDARK